MRHSQPVQTRGLNGLKLATWIFHRRPKNRVFLRTWASLFHGAFASGFRQGQTLLGPPLTPRLRAKLVRRLWGDQLPIARVIRQNL